jgi:hypothetical protein
MRIGIFLMLPRGEVFQKRGMVVGSMIYEAALTVILKKKNGVLETRLRWGLRLKDGAVM